MSSIGGLSSSSVNSLKGFGGLASGLDRDELIEGMTYATQSKIDGQNQKKDLAEWRQEAIRKLSSSMNDFSNKYLSFASSSNLIGESLYSSMNIETIGTHKDALSVKGSSDQLSSLSVLGIKSLAHNASMTSTGTVTDQKIIAKALDKNLAGSYSIGALEGETLSFKVGDKNYNVTLQSGEGYAYGTKQEAIDSINKSLEEVAISATDTLADVLEFKLDGGRLNIAQSGGNNVELTSGSGDVLEQLGFDETQGKPIEIAVGNGITAAKKLKTTKQVDIKDALSGADFTIEYNGESKKIILDEYKDGSNIDTLQQDLQRKLDESFGKGRITVKNVDGKIQMETTKPSGGVDNSSTLSIVSGSKGVVGKDSVLGFQRGESNRMNLGVSLEVCGSKHAANINKAEKMTISNANGDVIDLEEYNINWDSSVKEIIDTINGIKDLGISVSYQENLDKFVVQSTEQGASGQIQLGGTLATALFGESGKDYDIEQGQDAVVRVKFGGEEMDIVRGSNEINLDGITISAKEEFGFDKEGNLIDKKDAVTFHATLDSEKTVETVEEMIKDYNAILESVNKEYATKYNRSYAPLTDKQREEMSESEIKNWEEKAKEGLLYNDSDVRGLASEMRFLIPVGMQQAFKEIGIEVSSSYSDNGKLVFDKTKFQAALEKDPEKVKELMTNDSTIDNEKGFMVQIEDTFKKYAGMTGATKGIFVERAGSIHAPTTMFNNEIQDSIKDIDSVIDRLQAQLEAETDRYVKQFTTLETLISQMNSQSSTLSSYLGM